jgi:hypothetical protein
MISEKALRDFKAIWKEEYGETISDQVAMEEAVNMLTMYDKIYRPVKKEWIEDPESQK